MPGARKTPKPVGLRTQTFIYKNTGFWKTGIIPTIFGFTPQPGRGFTGMFKKDYFLPKN
uniref:Uncharacterized protein n=1 Tax=Romanomermis culicivorax TaxID=13658 RepID=A0A915KJB9_ROMCU